MQRSVVNHVDPADGVHPPASEQDDAKDGETDGATLSQIEQRLLETQKQRELFKAKAASAQILEKKYEELIQKHKALLAQLQQMAVMIEHYKVLVGQLEQEKILLAAENKSLKAQESIARDKAMLYNLLMERSKKLEEENSSLVLESERQQKMYEKCFDEISSQVVDALLMQKGLQEQCRKLQDRVRTLESQNAEFNRIVQNGYCNGLSGGTVSGPESSAASASGPPMTGHMSSSDTRLQQLLPYLSTGGLRKAKLRTQAASPSADSVQSMPAPNGTRWCLSSGSGAANCNSAAEGGSMGSLDFDQFAAESEQFAGGGVPEMSSPPLWMAAGATAGSGGMLHDDHPAVYGAELLPSSGAPRSMSVDSELTSVCIETEFPANSGSPKARRVERHSSSGSLDAALHQSRGFIKFDGSDVRHGRSASAEALRDARISRQTVDGGIGGHVYASAATTPRLQLRTNHLPPSLSPMANQTADTSATRVGQAMPAVLDSQRRQQLVNGDVTAAGATTRAAAMAPITAEAGRRLRAGDDIFSDDADDILAKHKSLIVVGSFEDLFVLSKAAEAAAATSAQSSKVQRGREMEAEGAEPPPPLPPPRSRSRCSSLSSISSIGDESEAAGASGDASAATAPPLPPRGSRRQQQGKTVLRRPAKPMQQLPPAAHRHDDNDPSLSSSTDTESIKQEINVLTSQLVELAKST